MMVRADSLLAFLKANYKEAGTSLVFHNPFECLVSIVLSAQTTDKSVNKVTPHLFQDFPSPKEMSLASIKEIEGHIHSLGLYHHKAKNLKALALEIQEKHGGAVPLNKKELMKMPGVGNKTAGVFLLEMGIEESVPVDTHISRLAYRLGYAKKDEAPIKIEKKLEKAFPPKDWVFLHHALIYFGRDRCKAQKPICEGCPFIDSCHYQKLRKNHR